ncbi:uncharacterized protein LOC141852095 [Brevipalpus obovatus]|uniref:uncharacterized protein LOC141852095 n=1 Tax=Brevipalpus obovatus TaxID=246614 RepID=UPI003D9F0EDD
MATPEKVTAGTSRSGRVIKKSAKVIEMEETEKSSSVPNVDKSNHRTSLSDSLIATNGMKATPEADSNSSIKKRIKMKIPPPDKDFNSAIMMEGDDDGSSKDFEESVLSITTSIHSTGGATPAQTTPSSSTTVKTDRPSLKTKITIPEEHRKVKPLKINRKLIEGESSANKLFAQITSGTPHIDHRRKGFRRNEFTDRIGNLDFGSDDSNSDEPSLTIATNTEDCVAAAVAHAKSLKAQPKPAPEEKKNETKGRGKSSNSRAKADKSTPETPAKPEKKRRGPLLTAYTLFSRENRSKVQQSNPTLDFANVSRKLGKIWQSLPNKEKIQWKRKAQKISAQRANENSPTKATSKKESSTSHPTRGIRSDQNTPNTPLKRRKDCIPIDVAAHLKLLGMSLTAASSKLSSLNSNSSNSNLQSQTLSVLLDSTLCAIAPLICLSKVVQPDVISKEVHEKIIDNISYILPSVYH